MDTIIVDTEYTTWPGALESGWSLPGQHREIVQIAAIRVDQNFKPMSAIDIFVKPKINPILSPLFSELTNIEQWLVDRDGINFPDALRILYAYSEGDDLPVVCMNADEAVMRENCQINEIDFCFKNSWHRLRPYLETIGVDLSEMSSGDLHKLTPAPLVGHTHNALHDVSSMARYLEYAGVGIDALPTGAPTTDPRSRPI